MMRRLSRGEAGARQEGACLQDCPAPEKTVCPAGSSLKNAKQPWGVIAAYFKGPGELTFEIEQVLK
jgi:hypothetical protein